MLCLCGVLLHSQKPQPAKETDLFITREANMLTDLVDSPTIYSPPLTQGKPLYGHEYQALLNHTHNLSRGYSFWFLYQKFGKCYASYSPSFGDSLQRLQELKE